MLTVWKKLRNFVGMELDSDKTPKKVKSIYARGADDGFLLGLYLSVLFLLTVAAVYVAFADVLVVAMIIGVPFLTYFFLRRTHVAAHGLTSFSALWMQGITMFACGSLIFGTVSFVYLRWIEPGFLGDVLRMGIDYYRASPVEAANAIADELQSVIDNNAVPSALNVSLGWMWLGMFSGSILSMAVAVVVRIRKVRC